MSRRKNEYALYKGENLIGIGTAKELAELTGVSEWTIYYYGTPTYQKRTSPEKGRRLVKLED